MLVVSYTTLPRLLFANRVKWSTSCTSITGYQYLNLTSVMLQQLNVMCMLHLQMKNEKNVLHENAIFHQNVYPPPWAFSIHPVFCCFITTDCPLAAAIWACVGKTPGGGG